MDWRTVGVRLGPILSLGFGLGAAVCIFVISSSRRKLRAASTGYVREQLEARIKRFVIFSAVLVVLTAVSGALWGVSVRKPELLPTPVPTATSTLIPSPTPRTPTVTFTPTPTPTATATPTELPIPADSDLPVALRTPFPTQAVTPGTDATLVEVVLAAGEKDDRPVNPTTRLPKGTERVYAFFTFDGMSRNVPWVHAWYGEVDGQMVELWSKVELWAYDSAQGRTWRYCNCRPGKGEIRVYVGQRLQQRVPFVVGDGE